MNLAAENIALKAENARLREALDGVIGKLAHDLHELTPGGMKLGTRCIMNNLRGLRLAVEDGQQALAQPTPTTPETDKAQAVINAACAHHINSHYGGPDLLCDCGICKAVEAYRGGA